MIDDETKLSALKFTLPQWLKYFNAPCVLRVRGRYASEVMDFCATFQSVRCVRDSDFLQWRRQTLWDTKFINTHFIMLYLEDHMLSPSAPKSHLITSELLRDGISIFQYSWFPQYSKIREAFSVANSEVIPIKVESSNLEYFLQADYRWIVSMTSIFERNFFRKILRSSRPYLRRKNPKAPYDIEQRPDSTWFLPVNFGISLSEIGISLDDENGVDGYSAISRGLYSGNKSEWAKDHDERISSIYLARQLKAKVFPRIDLSQLSPFLRKFIINVVYWPSYFSYSIKAGLFTLLDSITEIYLIWSGGNHSDSIPNEKNTE